MFSLVVAAASYYSNYVAPFSPVVTIGNVVWHPANVPFPTGPVERPASDPQADKQITKALALLVPITLTHAGGLPGVMEDLVVRLSRLDNPGEWIFVPQVFVDERAYFTTFGPADHLKWIIAPFYPVALPRGAQVERFVLLSSVASPRFSGGVFGPGQYSLRVLAKFSGRDDYSEIASRKETLTQAFIDDLLRGERWSTTPSTLTEARARIR